MRYKLNPKKGMAALCAVGATNLLMSGAATQENSANNETGQSLLSRLSGVSIAEAAAAQKKPNVVILMVDNLGWGEIGAYGGGILRGAETPNLDKMATQGMKLLNFNVEPQCTPTRSAFMTCTAT